MRRLLARQNTVQVSVILAGAADKKRQKRFFPRRGRIPLPSGFLRHAHTGIDDSRLSRLTCSVNEETRNIRKREETVAISFLLSKLSPACVKRGFLDRQVSTWKEQSNIQYPTRNSQYSSDSLGYFVSAVGRLDSAVVQPGFCSAPRRGAIDRARSAAEAVRTPGGMPLPLL